MHHLLEHINQDIKRRYNKSKQNEHRSKRTQQANPDGPDNSQSTWPSPPHQQISPQVGNATEREVQLTSLQPKMKAKLSTITERPSSFGVKIILIFRKKNNSGVTSIKLKCMRLETLPEMMHG